MLRVKARSGESIQDLIRRFKKLSEKEGLLRDMKRNAYYEKPSEKNRRRMRKAQRIESLSCLYDDQEPPTQLIKVVHIITGDLIKYLKRNPAAMYQIKPRQFEELIAEILASYKWEVQLTPPTKDGGYDIFAISKDISTGLKTSWVIECKKYKRENKVSVDIVRALYGVKSNLGVANALLATTSFFTKGAEEFKESRYDIELKDYRDILEWINEYRPNPRGKLYLKDNRLILPGEE